MIWPGSALTMSEILLPTMRPEKACYEDGITPRTQQAALHNIPPDSFLDYFEVCMFHSQLSKCL
jgi:hypothetical protein